MIQSIQDNLKQLEETLKDTIDRAGRQADEVKLIAVSKTHPAEKIQAAFDFGQRRFGENKIQDAIKKIPDLPSESEWHFIGPLQKNKARFCSGNFQWIHSIHSVSLVKELEKRCGAEQSSINVLLQANLSSEESKSGVWEWDDLCVLAESVLECQWLNLRGLMTMAAPNVGELETRKTFANLREWKEKLAQKFDIAADCTELSMGMSADYPWAIQEGATFVRVGSAIFGARG